jgi:hypothetical protein
MDGAFFSMLVAALLGAVGYGAKKYTDWRIDRALSGQLDVIRRRHVARFDAVVRIHGMLAEADHCIRHVRDGDLEYVSKCQEWCMKVRQESRAMVALIGSDLVERVAVATDIGLKYARELSPALFDEWKSELPRLYSRSSVVLREIPNSADDG